MSMIEQPQLTNQLGNNLNSHAALMGDLVTTIQRSPDTVQMPLTNELNIENIILLSMVLPHQLFQEMNRAD